MTNSEQTNWTNEQLLGAWLEGDLSPSQQQLFDQRCAMDKDFASQVDAASTMAVLAEQQTELEVPDWNAGAIFNVPETTKWWQWQGLPAMSFATSCMALILVVAGLNPFAGADYPSDEYIKRADVDKLVAQKLEAFQQSQLNQQQQTLFALQQQLLNGQAKRTEALLAESREERRQDYVEWLRYADQQREEDQLFLVKQFNQMQQDFSQQVQLERVRKPHD